MTDAHALLRLCQLVSPALPIGGYNFSQGLEYAIDVEWVRDEATALDWIRGLATHAVGTLDVPVLLRLHDAWSRNDMRAVEKWNAFLLAARETAELRAEDKHLGRALAKVLIDLKVQGALEWTSRADGNPHRAGIGLQRVDPNSGRADAGWQHAEPDFHSADAGWQHPEPDFHSAGAGSQHTDSNGRRAGTSPLRGAVTNTTTSFAATFALAAVRWNISATDAACGYLWAWAENQTLAAVKAVPLGQSAGQRILDALIQEIPHIAERAMKLTDEDIGSAAPLHLIASAAHETQYTRLFHS